QDYYAGLAEWRQDQRKRAIEARMSDSTAIRDTSSGGGAGAAAAAAGDPASMALAAAGGLGGGGAGLGGAGQGRQAPPRPGSLNQGPSSPATDYLPNTVTPPVSRFELKAGHPIQI